METENHPPDEAFVDMRAVSFERDSLMAALEKFQHEISRDESDANEHISELIANIYQQFQYEEYLMETSRYPLDDIHTMEHNRIMSVMVHALTNMGEDARVSLRVVERLRIMFRVHAENFDQVLSSYFLKKHSC